MDKLFSQVIIGGLGIAFMIASIILAKKFFSELKSKKDIKRIINNPEELVKKINENGKIRSMDKDRGRTMEYDISCKNGEISINEIPIKQEKKIKEDNKKVNVTKKIKKNKSSKKKKH